MSDGHSVSWYGKCFAAAERDRTPIANATVTRFLNSVRGFVQANKID